MRALVTGGAGFVGQALVVLLVQRGWDVVVLDPARPHPAWPRGVEHLRGDVCDPADVTAAGRRVDAVFHTAGAWDGRTGGAERMHRLHVDGTAAVLELGAPTVLVSSSVTCGFGPMSRPGTEDDPSEDPAHPIRATGRAYRQSKLEAEALATAAGAWIANPDFVVGPGDIHGVVMGPLLRLARLPVVPAPAGGKCFVAVGDVADGLVRVLERGRPGRRYLLGAENRTYASVLEVLARAQGRRVRVLALPRATGRAVGLLPGLGRIGGRLDQLGLDRYRDASRARSELGWRPGPVDVALRGAIGDPFGVVSPHEEA